MEKFTWIVLLIIIVIGYFLRKKIFKVITFLFVPQKCKIEGKFIKSWKKPFLIPTIPPIGILNFENSGQQPIFIDEYFLSLRIDDDHEITLKIPLFILNKIKRQLKKGKRFVSFLCQKYAWDEETDVIEIIKIT